MKEKRKRIQEENVRKKQEKSGNKEGNDYEFEKEDSGVNFNDDDAEEAEAYIDEG